MLDTSSSFPVFYNFLTSQSGHVHALKFAVATGHLIFGHVLAAIRRLKNCIASSHVKCDSSVVLHSTRSVCPCAQF